MTFIVLFTIVGTAIGLIRGLPQLVRLLRSGNAHGVSLDSAATTSVVSFSWAAYGVLTSQGAVALASASTGVIFAMIALAALRYGRSIRELRVAPLWFLALTAVGGIGGVRALGAILALGILVANLPQVRIAWREPDLSGLSLGTWLLSMAEALTWGTYGLVAPDRAILTNGLLQLLTSGAVVALRLAKGREKAA